MTKRPMTIVPPAEPSSQVVEGPARFTVISPYCIRMEYAPNHGFVDAPTLFAINREARFERTTITRTGGMIVIDSEKVRLEYRPDGRPFHAGNLTARFNLNGKKKVWKPGQANLGNLGGPYSTLDGVSKAFKLPEGLLSRDGWYLLDDSGRPLLIDNWIAQRPGGGPAVGKFSPSSAVNPDMDWYLFAYGLDYKAALESLAAISGRVPMPRKHVLGSWYCRWYDYTADEFRQIVREYRDHDFSLDILVMDMGWHTAHTARYGHGHGAMLGWTGYTWNRKLIPEPKSLLREFRKAGIFVTLNDHPCDGVRDHEECYPNFMKRLGLKHGKGINPPFNAGDRRYMDAFFQTAHAPLEKQGVDFWWVDWQQDYVYPAVPGVPELRHLPWLNRLYYRHSENGNRRGQGFSRWGGWGDHRHPIHFSGDASACWDMLAFEIPFTAASGNAGCFFWAHDLGGFSGERNPETYTRWVQFGALSAALRLHSTGDKLDRRPWLWGQPYEEAIRGAFQLRSQILPYVYTSVRQCYDRMIPLLRPMYLEYPWKKESYKHVHQYLLGDHLLAAPIVTPGKGPRMIARQTVWFPPGLWYNFFTGERIEGGQTLCVTADITEIPLYVRAGVPLSLQPYTQRMSTGALSTLVVRCYPGTNGETKLYEDDGQSQGYAHGQCTWTTMRYERKGDMVCVRIDPVKGHYQGCIRRRSYRIELPAMNPAVNATINGKSVTTQYDVAQCKIILTVPNQAVTRTIEAVVTAGTVNPAILAQRAAQ